MLFLSSRRQNLSITRGKVLSWEYRSLRKRNLRPSSTPTILNAHSPNTLFYNKKIYHSLFVARTWQHFIDLLKHKNPQFTAFLDSNLHTRLAIVTENELGLAFFPRNLPKKISSRSVHVLFSYRGNKQTDKQTDRHTERETNQRR